VYVAGDVRLAVYKGAEPEDADYLVEEVVDEVGAPGTAAHMLLIKWRVRRGLWRWRVGCHRAGGGSCSTALLAEGNSWCGGWVLSRAAGELIGRGMDTSRNLWLPGAGNRWYTCPNTCAQGP
jgi:hypothetical protein